MLRIKRIYEEADPNDGARILVDRLWPRGVSKKKAAIDIWLKDIAPSADLRIWFDHKPERFTEFSYKYIEELSNNPAVDVVEKLLATRADVTLLYAARDPTINHAVVLQKFLQNKA